MNINRRVEQLGKHGFLLLLLLFSFVAAAVRADDTPVQNDSSYYEISTAAQLKWFAEQVNAKNTSINAVLTADIDLSTLNEEYWTPIGNGADDANILFAGVFDGCNHTISGLKVRPCLQSGLFGYANGATIRNLVIEQPEMSTAAITINRTNSAVGALCGKAIQTTIVNCHVRNAVLVPRENADSEPLETVGGICGYFDHSYMSKCTASGYIESQGSYAGGIAALVHVSQIDTCHFLNTSKGASRVYAQKYAGGIAGGVRWRSVDVCLAGCTNDNATVKAADATTCGKIYGYEEFDVTQVTTYNGYAEIYTPDNLKVFATYINNGTDTRKAKLMRDINMSAAGTFTPMGTKDHPFDGEFDGQGHTIDSLTINNQTYAGLFGYVKDGSIKNLTLTNPSLSTQGNSYLGFIAGLITQNSGHETPVGYIENCHVKNGNLLRDGSGEPEYVGGIVGKADMSAAVRDCSFQGVIMAHENFIGGLIGQMNSGASIERCYITGASTVWGNNYVGGVVGNMEDTDTRMTDCYADQSQGEITLHAEAGNYSGMLCGKDNSGTSGSNKSYTEGNLQYKLTGKQISVGGKTAHETKITGVASAGQGSYYAIVDIGTSNNYFTTEIENVNGVEELYFWDNNSNIAGTEACGWIDMKIDDYAFGSSFKTLKMVYRVFAGDDHDVMLRPGDVRPAGDKMFANCPNAKVYVDAEYYDEFCNDSLWSKYKDCLVSTTSMRTEDVNAEYGARYAYDRNRDATGTIVKVGNGSTYGSSQVHVIGPDNDYIDDHEGTLWIYQDIGQTYDYNTTKVWASSFNGKDNVKQVKFQEITKSASSASQTFCITLGDSAFANCKNLERFEVALYSDEGSDHAESLRPENMPIGKDVFAGSTNVKIYVPRDLVTTFQNDTTYGWSQYKDLISEGDFGNSDWTEDGVVYSYYTSDDGQTRYTNDENNAMEEKLSTWSSYYRNFSASKILEYGNGSTIKYVFASGVDDSKLTDGKLKIYSDIGETYPHHYKTLALSASGFQDKTGIKSISFEDIVANNYNTVTNFSLVIPSNTFSGCSNLKELNMFLYVTKGDNHYVAIKPSQVFIGEHVFDNVNEDFRIKVLPEYYDDYINDANWGQYKDYIVACDYLPIDKKTIERDGVTYDYATKVMNDISTNQLVSMKSSWWNALTIGVEAIMATYSAGLSQFGTQLTELWVHNSLNSFTDFLVGKLVVPFSEAVSTGNALKPAGVLLVKSLAAIDAGIVVGLNTTGVVVGDNNIGVNYLINRTKKCFERSSTFSMQGQWMSTEQITNIPRMYVKSVEDQGTVTIYNDVGTNNDDYQTVAIAFDAFHNKTKLTELKFQERYGTDSRSLASGMTIALPDSMFKGCTNFTKLNLINYSTGAHSENHCYKGLTPDNFIPMGDIFAGLDSLTRSQIQIIVGEEELQDFLDDEYWSQYKNMFQTKETPIVNKQTEWSCKYALAYDKNTLPLRTTSGTHDIDHVMIYGADNEDLESNGGLAALINDFGEWNNYKLDYVKAGAFKGNDKLKILDMTDTHTNVADVYDANFNVTLQDSAFAHCKNFTDLNLIYQVTDGTNHTESMSPSQFTLGKGVFDDTPNLKIKFCLDQEDAFLADTSWVKYKDKFTPCFFEPLDEKVGDLLLSKFRFLTKLNDGTNFDHVDATRAYPAGLKYLFQYNSKITSFDEFRAFSVCGLDTIYYAMFSCCDSLQTIMLPATITTIDTDAFKSCQRLHKLTIPAKVKTIRENAFTESGIKEFTMESGTPAKIDAKAAFAGLLNDDYIIYVPDSAVSEYKTQWADVADHINGISQRHGLKVVTLTKAGTLADALGLTYDYTDYVFDDNHLYGNYAQYDSLRIIGPLNGKDIGVIRYMGGRDVDDCNPTIGHLKYLDLYDADIKYDSEEFTYNRDLYELHWYNLQAHLNDKITADNVIDDYMFYGLDKLETLILPRTATRIAEYALRGCSRLKYLVVGDNMTEIDDYVAGLTDSKVAMVMLSKKAPEIDYDAFITKMGQFNDGSFYPTNNEEKKFSAIIVPEGTMNAYSSKSGITVATDSIITNFKDEALVTALKEKHVFSVIDLMNTRDITGYVNGNKDIKDFDELYYCAATKLGDGTLTGMAGLQKVALPYGLKTITAKAFEGCDSLRTINAFGTEIPTLEKDAFESLPEDFVVYVTEGEEDAYRAAWTQYADHIQGYRAPRTAIREVTLKKANTLADSLNATITMDGDLVVAVGGNLSSITGLKVSGPIGGKDLALIRYLGGREPDNNQHVYTTNLKYLDLYDANLKEDDYYFQLKGNNRRINEDNVVPKDMLWNCDNLETVILPRTATELDYEACYDMASLKTLVIGDKTKEIANDALGENRKLQTIIFLCESKPKLNGDAFTDPIEGANRRVEKMYVRKELANDYHNDSEYSGHANQITTGFSDINQFRAFGCKGIASEDDLAGVTTVEGWFNNFPNLTMLGLLNKTKITGISKNTFSKATGLQQVALPATMSTIEDGAFSANANLHWLDISKCDALKNTDVSKYGVNDSALVYVPESFGEQTADNVVDGTLHCAKYNLAASHDYDVLKAFTADKVVFGRQFVKDGKYTITLPFTASVPSGFKAFKLSSDADDKLTFKRVASVEAYMPYVLIAETDGNLNISGETTVKETTNRLNQVKSTNYTMTGTLATISNADAINYSEMVMDNDGKWATLTNYSGKNIEPLTAYLQASTSAGKTYNVASEFIDFTTVTLNEATDNRSVIAENNGDYVIANLTRTLKTGGWNTFCVPFDTKIEGTPLAGASVLGLAGINGNVYNFAKVDSLKAGEPYLVKPATEIANPTFDGVKINNTLREFTGDYDFLGTFNPMMIDATKTTYFLDGDGKLKLAKGGTTLNGLRAYFKVSEANAGAKLVLNLGDEVIDAINDVEAEPESGSNAVYSVSGIYMGNDINALPSGVYIVNGKKIIK